MMPLPLRLIALVLLPAFLFACTRQVARGPLETRRFAVDWEALEPQRLQRGDLRIEGVVLTPAQWPLEASVKNLLKGDFLGVVTGLDLRFRPSTLRSDVLERLLEAGYVPAFLRVRNEGKQNAPFDPNWVFLRVDEETAFPPVPADGLPDLFQEIDWAATGFAVVITALAVALVVVSQRNPGFNRRERAIVRPAGRLHPPLRGFRAGPVPGRLRGAIHPGTVAGGNPPARRNAGGLRVFPQRGIGRRLEGGAARSALTAGAPALEKS
ncbi:MAG: hypothetical protein IIA14_09360 [SAR324 cluster bacterium]|nr:hypothetical protein [SAR324 cluster bacterium]